MTEEQFKEITEKVKKYSDTQSCIDRLNREKGYVDSGIEQIRYKDSLGWVWYIDCLNRHEGFKGGLTDAILQFYDSEIERLQKQLEEL